MKLTSIMGLRYGYKMWRRFLSSNDIDVKSTLFNPEITLTCW